jgi:hypothetical protein
MKKKDIYLLSLITLIIIGMASCKNQNESNAATDQLLIAGVSNLNSSFNVTYSPSIRIQGDLKGDIEYYTMQSADSVDYDKDSYKDFFFSYSASTKINPVSEDDSILYNFCIGSVRSLDSMQIAVSKVFVESSNDSMFIVKRFEAGDTIQNWNLWKADTTITFFDTHKKMNNTWLTNGTDGYIAFRFPYGKVTLYGWMKINTNKGGAIELFESSKQNYYQ